MAQPILLEEFPAEIIDHILQYLPKDALASLRLASRVFQQQATPFLYRQLTLRYSDVSAAKSYEVMKRPDLARLVREYRLDVNRIAYDHASYRTRRHMNRISTIPQELPFHRLNSVSMTFGVTMNEGIVGETYARDMADLAIYLLTKLLSSHTPPLELHSLSIEKLPCCCLILEDVDRLNSQCLRSFRKLEIGIITLEPDWSPTQKRVRTYHEAMKFYARFPRVLLAPASHTLRVLHLSADAPWGWYPKIDLRSIHFPYLESLTLSRFTFSHDWQMYWLVNHADTLKRLSLTNCAILCHATSTSQYLDREGYPQKDEYDFSDEPTAFRHSYHYKKRWSNFFLGFAGFLRHLQSFSLVASDPVIRDGPHYRVPADEIRACGARDRYLKYDSTSYP